MNRLNRHAFTLLELLIVIFIIAIVSAVALPVVLPAMNHHQVSEAARIVQGALVGARDKAIHDNKPSGIRLMPDPAYQTIVTDPTKANYGFLDPSAILAANRIIPLDPAPDYSEGLVSIDLSQPLANFAIPYPVLFNSKAVNYSVNGLGGATGIVLMIEEAIANTNTAGPDPIPNAPTSWFWNIRVGDKLQINNSGIWYTVVGPMNVTPANGNPEMFVNVGAPGAPLPLVRGIQTSSGTVKVTPEFLFLVNGRDDNHNGWIDEGWDGVDNDAATLANGQPNPGAGLIDDIHEWEPETWPSTMASAGVSKVTGASYTIRRRPAPSSNAREIALPTDVVIDLTTAFPGGTRERSRVPVAAFNQYTGAVDIVLNPDGTVLPTTVYSSPSSFDMTTGSFVHLWLSERGDLHPIPPNATVAPFLPIPADALPGAMISLKGDYRLVTLFSRTGGIVVNASMPFLYDHGGTFKGVHYPPRFTNTVSPFTAYGPNYPFIQAQQGMRGDQ